MVSQIRKLTNSSTFLGAGKPTPVLSVTRMSSPCDTSGRARSWASGVARTRLFKREATKLVWHRVLCLIWCNGLIMFNRDLWFDHMVPEIQHPCFNFLVINSRLEDPRNVKFGKRRMVRDCMIGLGSSNRQPDPRIPGNHFRAQGTQLQKIHDNWNHTLSQVAGTPSGVPCTAAGTPKGATNHQPDAGGARWSELFQWKILDLITFCQWGVPWCPISTRSDSALLMMSWLTLDAFSFTAAWCL